MEISTLNIKKKSLTDIKLKIPIILKMHINLFYNFFYKNVFQKQKKNHEYKVQRDWTSHVLWLQLNNQNMRLYICLR